MIVGKIEQQVIRLFTERQPLTIDGTGMESGGRRGSQHDGIESKGCRQLSLRRGSPSQKSLVALTLEPSLLIT
jgi:hypothetical protein